MNKAREMEKKLKEMGDFQYRSGRPEAKIFFYEAAQTIRELCDEVGRVKSDKIIDHSEFGLPLGHNRRCSVCEHTWEQPEQREIEERGMGLGIDYYNHEGKRHIAKEIIKNMPKVELSTEEAIVEAAVHRLGCIEKQLVELTEAIKKYQEGMGGK